jgi:hypothetical protein
VLPFHCLRVRQETGDTMATKAGIRRRNQNNCRRKIPYETLKDAKDRARLVRQLIHEVVLAYRCPLSGKPGFGSHWHIGHPPDKRDLSDNDVISGKHVEEVPKVPKRKRSGS